MSAGGKILIPWERRSTAGHAPAVPWGTCLTDTSGPTVFPAKNELWLPPRKKPPQTCDLIRDNLKILVMLEDPKFQLVAVVKGPSASGCWRRSWVLWWDCNGGRRRRACSSPPRTPDPVPVAWAHFSFAQPLLCKWQLFPPFLCLVQGEFSRCFELF